MNRWQDHKVVHVILVLLVFTCTGLSVAWLGRQIADFSGIERYSLAYWLLWTFAMLPIYNVILLVYAFLFGKFQFFRNKQKKTWKRIKGLFSRKKKD